MRKPGIIPDLVEIVTGYAGPSSVEFNGGSISIDAVLIYRDGIRVHWQIQPQAGVPGTKEPSANFRALPETLRATPEIVSAHLMLRWLSDLWGRSCVRDDGGTPTEFSMERAIYLETGWSGTSTSPTAGFVMPTEIELLVDGNSTVIPCDRKEISKWKRVTSFRAAYPGPIKAEALHGGGIRLISALVYADHVTIEWLLDPIPDFGLLSRDDASSRMHWGNLDREHGVPRGSPSNDQAIAFWLGARLIDDLGTGYVGSLGYVGNTRSGGLKGEIVFKPTVPWQARELNLVVGDFSTFVPLVDSAADSRMPE